MAIAAILGALGMATSVAGSVMQFGGALAQSSIQRTNAELARKNALLAEFSGREQARQISVAGTKALGSIKANAAASGLKQSGSILDFMREQELQYEYDAAKAEFNGQQEAFQQRYQAQLMRLNANVNTINAGFRLGTSLSSTALGAFNDPGGAAASTASARSALGKG